MSEADERRPGGGCGFLEYHAAHDFWIEGNGSGRRVHCTGLHHAPPAIPPPGPCWHDSGITYLGERDSVHCDLLAGHAGAHQNVRPRGGTVVWTESAKGTETG